MTTTDLTAELRDVLVDGQGVSGELLARLESLGELGAAADPVEIVNLLEALARIDERRAGLLDRFRREASSLRRREKERSIRQFVLRALDQIGTPQTTGFLEDYLYTTELIEAKSRGMGALRRDEYRAWDRLRDRPRVAYIVPCLDEEGRAVPRWMARSDWSLASRLTVGGAEDLWALQRVIALLQGYQESDPNSEALYRPLIERYASEALNGEFAVTIAGDRTWADELRGAVSRRRDDLAQAVAASQEQAANRLADLDEARRFWGLSGDARTRPSKDD